MGTGILEVTVAENAIGPIRQKNGTLRIAADLNKESIRLTGVDFVSNHTDVTREGNALTLSGTKIHGDFTYEYRSRALYSKAFQCEVPPSVIKGNFWMSARGEKPWKAFIQADRIDFAHLFNLMKPIITRTQGNAWTIKGQGAAEARLEGRLSGENPHFGGQMALHFTQGGFRSGDGTKIGQKIEGSVTIHLNRPMSRGKNKLNITSEIKGGEYLIGSFYRDMCDERLQMSSMVAMPTGVNAPVQFRGTLNLLDTGTYSFEGSINKNNRVISVRADKISHERIASLILRDYLAEQSSGFREMSMKGHSGFLVHVSWSGNDVRVNGTATLKDSSLALPAHHLTFDRINLDLPFSLFFPASGSPPPDMPEGETGILRIGIFEKKGIRLHDITVPLALRKNAFAVVRPVDLVTYGARVKISRCAVDNIFSPERNAAFAFSVHDVRLDYLFPELKGIGFIGSMEADFPLITYEDGWWIMRKKTSVKLFGGEMDATDVSASSLFSRSRTIRGNLEFKSIDLEKATKTIKLGKMTGVINVSIRNIEIDYGEPSRFIMDIDSVPTGKTDQKVSVEAIDNISFLGTGTEIVGAVLRSGFRRFFKEYPYSRIGIRVAMENDKLSIRGKIFDGGKEYMVRRTFLRGIDVVNHDPENVVSFKDMQERLARIFEKRGGKIQ